MKADDKNGLFGWNAKRDPNFNLIVFFVGELFESKLGKILLAAVAEGKLGLLLAKFEV